MAKWLLALVCLALTAPFTGCGSTPSNNQGNELAKLRAKYRAQEEADVARLTSNYKWAKWKHEVKDDFARHNWIEWPFAGTMFFLTWISTGHQKRDFTQIHKEMDRYLFNAAWDDPYLVGGGE